MKNYFSAYWWLFLLRGVLAIFFGSMALFWPAVTFATLIILMGAYLFIDGVFSVFGAVRARKYNENWRVILLSGICGIILGFLTFTNPLALGAFVVYLVAFWAIFVGLMEIILAIRLREKIQGEGWYILAGIVSIIFGVLFLINPIAAAVTLTWMFGFYAVVAGILLISLAVRLRKHNRSLR
jgi:uncharacterized membrane protein HdeD (DUF308 family)